MNAPTMKAVICTQYGGPEVLKIEEVAKPTPRDNEILIKIVASSVNSGDVRVRALAVEGFLRIIMRFVLGFRKPRKPILGVAFSGIVEQTGKYTKDFKVGDEVYGITGFQFGTYAEYIAVSEKSVIYKKPINATFEEAAALPFGGQTAIYFLEKAQIIQRKNPKVLIYGATGAVGSSAIQLSKYHNAEVTAVCSEGGKNLALELGAGEVIFYTQEDFTQTNEKFDIIFDAVGKITKKQCRHLLNENGSFVTVGGLEFAPDRVEQLQFLRELFEKGNYKAAIDRVYPMEEIVEAHRYVESGRKKGNVVLRIA